MIKKQSTYPDLKYNIDNVTLLCKECHDVVHNEHVNKASSILKRVLQKNVIEVARIK